MSSLVVDCLALCVFYDLFIGLQLVGWLAVFSCLFGWPVR